MSVFRNSWPKLHLKFDPKDQTAISRIFLFLVVIFAVGIGCSGQKFGKPSSETVAGSAVRIQGSGASFPKPIYEKWVSEFGKLNGNVSIDYQSTGSGAGQKALLAMTADFGASDDPMSDEDLKEAKGEILHIPTVLGAVVLTYNLGGITRPLNLTAETISCIYLGKITKWNDEKLKHDNPGLELPDTEILPVYRADSSGTSAVFTDFLSKKVPEWNEKVGSNKQPSWVTGIGVGAKGNDGVMGQVKQTPNSIGYVELTFAEENHLPTARIRNKAGEFMIASIESVSAAAGASVATMPDDLRTQITDADGVNSYPIASYTYILVYKDQANAVKGKAIADFLWWAVTDGQRYARALNYAPLPDDVVIRVKAKIASMSANGGLLRQ